MASIESTSIRSNVSFPPIMSKSSEKNRTTFKLKLQHFTEHKSVGLIQVFDACNGESMNTSKGTLIDMWVIYKKN